MSSRVATDALRVAVLAESERFDVVLPANIVVAALIPSLVDLTVTGIGPTPRGAAADWQLSRVGSGRLSARQSLADNDVHDGDLLLLRCVPRTLAPAPDADVATGMPVSLAGCPRWGLAARRTAGAILSVCWAGLAAVALLHGDRHAGAAVAGAVAVIAFAAAVASGRVYGQSLPAIALGVCSVVPAAAAGYLVVPGQALAPKAMLAAAAAASASVIVTRCIDGGTAVFTATASFASLSAAAAGLVAVAPIPARGGGALLAAGALVLLGLAARLALRMSAVDSDVGRASAIVTGLTCGTCAAAVLGAAWVTRGGGPVGAAFAVVVASALVLRSGTHVDLAQVSALVAGGALCFVATFVWAVTYLSHAGPVLGLVAAAVAACSAALSTTVQSIHLSPVARRCVELSEYAMLAAVIPLACWLCDVFAVVRAL